MSQGNQYWRFEGDVLDEDYPRDISVGFDGIPSDVDAAFAIPAPTHLGKEKAYFFKGILKYFCSHGSRECKQITRQKLQDSQRNGWNPSKPRVKEDPEMSSNI